MTVVLFEQTHRHTHATHTHTHNENIVGNRNSAPFPEPVGQVAKGTVAAFSQSGLLRRPWGKRRGEAKEGDCAFTCREACTQGRAHAG